MTHQETQALVEELLNDLNDINIRLTRVINMERNQQLSYGLRWRLASVQAKVIEATQGLESTLWYHRTS